MIAKAVTDPATIRRHMMCRFLIAEQRTVNAAISLKTPYSPEWAMLLDLYEAEHAGAIVSLSALWAVTDIPTTNAFRRTQRLLARGVIERRRDRSDLRRTDVALSETTRSSMNTVMDRLFQRLPPRARDAPDVA